MKPQPLLLKPLGEYANKRRRELPFEWRRDNQTQWNWLQAKGIASEFDHWAGQRSWQLGQWEYLTSIHRGVSEWARPTAEELVSRQPATAKLHVPRPLVEKWLGAQESRGAPIEATIPAEPPAPPPPQDEQDIAF